MERRRRLIPFWSLSALIAAILPDPAWAANIAWKTAVNGSWHTASNWLPAQVPGPGDVALITLSGNYTVSINSNASVGAVGLTSGTGTRRLHVNGSTLTTSTGIAVGITNYLTLNSGTVSGAGTIDVDGNLTTSGISVINTPIITHATTIIDATGTLTVSGDLTSRGTLRSGSPSLDLYVGGTLTNTSSGTFQVPASAPLDLLDGNLDNQGMITVDAYFSLQGPDGNHLNSGTIAIAGGITMQVFLTYDDSFTTSGSIQTGAGFFGSFTISGHAAGTNYFHQTGGSITGSGEVAIGGAIATFVSNPTCKQIRLVANATVTFPSGLTHDTQFLWLGLCHVTAPSLTIAAGKTLNKLEAGASLNIPTVSNSGTVQTVLSSGTSGDVTMSGGSWTNQPGSRLQLTGAGLVGLSSLTNSGEVELGSSLSSQTQRLQSGEFLNTAAGLLKTVAGAGGTRRLESQIYNQGLVDVQYPLTIASPGADHQNSQTINLSGGDLTIQQTGSTPVFINGGGTLSVPAGRQLRVSGGVFASTGSLAGAGTLVLDGGSVSTFSPNPTVSHIAIRQSQATFNQPAVHGASQTFELTDATLTAPQFTLASTFSLGLFHSNLDVPLFTNQGVLTVEQAGTVTGTISTIPGSQISMVASPGSGASSLVVGQAFTNNGEITLEPVDNASATLTVSSGTLVNAPGATIGAIATSPSALRQTYLNTTLDNRGHLAVNGNMTLARSSADHTNSGNITVGEGDLTIQQTGSTPSFTSTAGTLWINPDRTLRVQGGAITVSGGSVPGNGTLHLTGGAAANFSIFPQLSALTMQNATGTFPGVFNTDDTGIDLNGSELIANVTNTAGHTIPMVASSILLGVSNAGTLDIQGTPSALGFLVNEGLVTIQNGLLLSSGDSGQLNNGVIRVFGGTFSIVQTPAGYFSNGDTLKVYPGATVQTTGGTFRNEVAGVLAGGGTLDMSGTTFINNGTINPGASPGIMTITGNVTMGSTSVLNMEIGGAAPGSGYDQIQISGSAALNGTLNLSLVNGYFPTTGSTFDLLTCSSHSGQFANVYGEGVGFGNQLAFLPQPRPTDPIRLTTVAQAWSQAPGAGGPQRRSGHACVYTGVSDRLILFGGVGEGGEFNDTWICEGSGGGFISWSQLTTAGTPPAPRQGHAAAYDAGNNRLIVYGGSSAGNPSAFSDVWVLSNANGLGGTATWTQLAPGGGTPGPRTGGGAGYNPASNRLILFGGVYPPDPCNSASNDVWILSNANGLGGTPVWTLLPTGGLPPYPRSGAVLAYDNAANRLIVHGGSDACASILGEARYLTHADGLGGMPTWTTLPLSSPPAPGRTNHAGIYDAQTDRLITFGGLDAGSELLEDVFLLTGATNPSQSGWSSLPVVAGAHPSPRSGHSLAWDPLGRRIIVFGGNDGGFRNDLWILQLTLDPGPVSGTPDPVPPIGSPADPGDAVPHFGFRKAPWPNPTRGPASLTFGLPAAGDVSVDVFDVSGRHVRQLFSGAASEGLHEVRWNGEGDQGPVASGIYHVVVRSGKDRDSRRIAVLRGR